MTKDEALMYLKAIVEAFGPDDGIELDQKTWANLHTAIKEALAQHDSVQAKPEPEQDHCQCPECKITLHASDCAVHSEPAYPKGECDCGAQPKQKPMAWKLPDKNVVFWEDTKEVDEYHGFKPTIPLYPHPQRTWVGLTDEEIQECYNEAYKIVQGRRLENAFYKTIEAKLKQKNGYAKEKNT